MSKKWKPSTIFKVIDIINEEAIISIPIDSSIEKMHSILGDPELPPAKLSKGLPIFIYLYGNVSISVENGNLIAIDIDFHGNREKMVVAESIKNWGLNEWIELSKKNGWEMSMIYDTYSITSSKIRIGVSESGKIKMLSLR